MKAVGLALRWGPLPLAVWWLNPSLDPWPLVLSVLVCLLLPRRYILAIAVSAVAVWLGAPALVIAAAVAYRILYVEGLRLLFNSILGTHPVPQPTPSVRCSHGQWRALWRADRLLREGDARKALDQYLAILAAHDRDDRCARSLLERSAEAAVETGNGLLARELADAALAGLPATPIGSQAVIAARTHAVQARALALLGDPEAAASALRGAQRVIHRNRAAEMLVRRTAMYVELARQPPASHGDLVQLAVDAHSGMSLNRQYNHHVRQIRCDGGWWLLMAGNLDEAERAFRADIQELSPDRLLFWAWTAMGRRPPPWMRQELRLFVRSATGVLGCLSLRLQAIDADEDTFHAALALAALLSEPLMYAQLSYGLALARQREGSTEQALELLRECVRHADCGLNMFTDPQCQSRWAALRRSAQTIIVELTGTPDPAGFDAWSQAQPAGSQLADLSAEATGLFQRLANWDESVFGPTLIRVDAAVGALTVPDAEQTDPQVAPPNPPALVKGEEPVWTAVSVAATRTAIEHNFNNATGAEGPPADAARTGNVEQAASDTGAAADAGESSELAVAVPVDPNWLASVEDMVGTGCWTIRGAIAEARRLGHGHVGSEHLLLAALWDGGCATILRELGLRGDEIRARLSRLYGEPSGFNLDLAPEAAEVMRAARQVAEYADVHRMTPVHVLIAVLDTPGCVATQMLLAAAVDLQEARVRLIADFVFGDRPSPGNGAGPGWPYHAGLTLPARRTVRRASALAAKRLDGLVGATDLAEAALVEAWTRSGVGPLPANSPESLVTIRLSPAGRRALRTAIIRCEVQGHAGVDAEHFKDAIGDGDDAPPYSAEARDLIRRACVVAVAAGRRYVAPHHIAATAHAATQVPAESDVMWEWQPPVLTPWAKSVLMATRIKVREEGGAAVCPTDLRDALDAHGTMEI